MSPVGTGIVEEEDGCGGKVVELDGCGGKVELLLGEGGTTLVALVGATPLLELDDEIGSLLDEVPALVGAAPDEDTPAEDEDISEVKELELFFLGFFFGVVVQPLMVRASKLSKIPEIFLRI